MRIPTQMEAGQRERSGLYQSRRWRRLSVAFLFYHPVCVTPGCCQRSVIVDHAGGHQRVDWRERFCEVCSRAGSVATGGRIHCFVVGGVTGFSLLGDRPCATVMVLLVIVWTDIKEFDK
jgi:hypothetical protein